MRQLKPDKIISKLYTNEYLKLERELHNRYKKFRIPQTEYFRLEDYHLKEIKQRISTLDYSMSMILEISIKSLIFILFIFFTILLLIYLNINDVNIILLKSVILMERISFGLSFLSFFFHSGKYLSFFSEIKYRLLRLFVFVIFAFIFRIASVSL